MSNKVTIRVFTDPTCPFAYSAEPSRWRLKWLYGDQLKWQTTMIVLAETPEVYVQKNFTTGMQAKSLGNLRDKYGMPIQADERPRIPASILACKAYLAIRNNQPAAADHFLRKTRLATMDGQLVDEPEVIMNAAYNAGVNPSELKIWLEQAQVEKELRDGMTEARQPTERALALKNKLSPNGDGYRYSAPSYQFIVEGVIVFELPGYWPTPTYEAVIPNIAPTLVRQDDAKSVQQALEWAGEPLATVEVAALTGKPLEETRNALNKIASMEPLGQDGFWSLK